MLGSARSKEFMTEEGQEKAIKNLHDNGIEGLVAVSYTHLKERCSGRS